MALHLTKPKRRFLTNPSLIHLFSTSSSSSPPPQNEIESTEQSQSQSQSSDSKIPFYINNIRSSLKRNPQSDLQSVRKNLNEFRRRQTESSSSSSARGLADLYNEKASSLNNSRDGSRKSEIYGNIKENLRQMRSSLSSSPQQGNIESNWMSSFQSDRTRSSESFVRSNVIGLGLTSSESKEKKEEMKNELFRRYDDEELGEKLRMFRPEGVKEESWFSLKELNERLVKLREVEEEEVARRTKEGDGLRFQGLRAGLQQAKDEEAKKNRPFRSMDIWGVLTGRPTHLSEPPKEQLVETYFHPDNMSCAEKMKIKLAEVREEFKMSESDCGSARVQVAQLTTKIKHLSSVLHKKDKHSRKGLLAMVQRRKKLLKYMRRTDWDSYCISLSKLGLRDNPDYKFVS